MDAFAGIMDRYQRPVFHCALQMVRNVEDARELTQQVFLRAYEHLRTFDRSRRFFSWIYRIAVNESINFLKTRKLHEPIEGGPEPADSAMGAGEAMDDDLRHGALRRAVQALGPHYAPVVTLFHFLQLSYEEVAEALDLPEKTVKSRLFTARQLLRGEMEKRGHGY